MRKLLLSVLLALGVFAAPANAQQQVQALTVSSCGSESLIAATYGYITMDTTGALCSSVSVSASITGFPGTSQTTGTPISVTTSSVTGTLPAGTVVVASNVGTTNNAYCKLGASATTSDQLIAPNSWFGFTVGSATQLSCITSASTTTVNMVGGAGLPTGAGGGGGGGGGSVTQGTIPWVSLPTPALKGPRVYVNVNAGTGATPITLPAGSPSTYPVICLVPVLPQSDVYYELGAPAATAIVGTSSHLGVIPICQGYTGDTSITAVAASPGTVEVTQWSAYPTFGSPVATYPSLAPYGAQIFNLVSINGSAPIFGVGPSAAGVMRVAPTNDSLFQIWNGINSLDVLAPSTLPLATNRAMPVSLMPNSPGLITFGSQADTLAVPILQTPTASATSALSHASTTALGTSLVVKATPGNLYGFNCAGIAGGSGGNCIAYNGTTVPGTGALTGANVLDFCTFDTSAKGCSLSRIPMAVNYGTGIVILLSSAASPYTYTTGTDTGAISSDYK